MATSGRRLKSDPEFLVPPGGAASRPHRPPGGVEVSSRRCSHVAIQSTRCCDLPDTNHRACFKMAAEALGLAVGERDREASWYRPRAAFNALQTDADAPKDLWKRAAYALLQGVELLGHAADGSVSHVPAVQALAGKHIALYFSAHWCPPCRGFTPILAEVYGKISSSRDFEVVFCSSDRDARQFQARRPCMQWLKSCLPVHPRGLLPVTGVAGTCCPGAC